MDGLATLLSIAWEPAMRKLAVLTFVSLDGVMQSPKFADEDPSGGFTLGGWAEPCWDDVMQNVGQIAMSQPYDVLLGRSTYDSFAPNFSGSDSPLDRGTKYVVSTRPIETVWEPTIQIRQDAVSAIAKLKEEDGPLLQVHGSHGLIQLLLEHQLIDEYRIWTFPVILGAGKRLFGSGTVPANLILEQTAGLSSGAIMSVYRKAE